MKKHLALTCFAYLFFGVGMTVQQLGIKAGLGLELTLGIFISSTIFFLVVVLTSMEKVKKILYKKDEDLPVSPTKKPQCGVGKKIA